MTKLGMKRALDRVFRRLNKEVVMGQKVRTCPSCGSQDVLIEARAYWNVMFQRWVVYSVRPPSVCNCCGFVDGSDPPEVDLDELPQYESPEWDEMAAKAHAKPHELRTAEERFVVWWTDIGNFGAAAFKPREEGENENQAQ